MADDKAKQPARWRFDHLCGTEAESRWSAAVDPAERAELDLEIVNDDPADPKACRIHL